MSNSASRLRKQQQLAGHAHRMRSAPSEPERVLWQALRSQQLGVQFRRQVTLQGYVAPAVLLVVVVDGAHHMRQRAADKRRDAVLSAVGLRVLRIPARTVLQRLDVALGLAVRALASAD